METPKEATKTTPQKTLVPDIDPQAGWWSLRDKRGSLAGVCAAVDADTTVPDFWKPTIKESLKRLCESTGSNFCYLDAHWFVAGNKANVHIAFEADKVL